LTQKQWTKGVIKARGFAGCRCAAPFRSQCQNDRRIRKKEGDFVEYGTISDSSEDKKEKAKAAYGEIVKRAEAGDLEWVKEHYPKVYLQYPNHFQKELNKWWCGYKGEEVVAIEEWSPKNECTGSQLKIWADRYPFTGQIKGGSLKKIRPKKIIVLSNYTIEECFPAKEDHLPLKRRFKVTMFYNLEAEP